MEGAVRGSSAEAAATATERALRSGEFCILYKGSRGRAKGAVKSSSAEAAAPEQVLVCTCGGIFAYPFSLCLMACQPTSLNLGRLHHFIQAAPLAVTSCRLHHFIHCHFLRTAPLHT